MNKYERKKRKRWFIFGLLVITMLIVTTVVEALFFNDLEDVNVSTAVTCNTIHYNGSAWVNYDLWNQTIIWYKDHTFNENITAKSFHGDGGNLTNVSGTGDGYAGSTGHPHNQDLNTTDDIIFHSVNATQFHGVHFGDGGNLTNITASGDGYAGPTGHPHNQDLNTTSSVNFTNVTVGYDYPYKIRLGNPLSPTRIYGDIYTILSAFPSMKTYFVMEGGVVDYVALDNTVNVMGLPVYDLTIDTNGIITTIYQPACRVRLTTNQNIPTSAWTKLNLDVKDYDQNSDYNTVSMRFVAPVTGIYQINYNILATNVGLNSVFRGQIYKNGVASGCYISITNTAGGSMVALSGSDTLRLITNDFIELYVYHSTFPNLTYTAGTSYNYMTIVKLA